MAERDYRGVELTRGPSVAPEAVAPVRVGQQRQQSRTPSIAEEALTGLVGSLQGFAEQNFQRSVQEHYIAGQRASALGQAVEEVEADPLMAPFVHGGYNDANWQASQAAFSAKMQQFIQGEGRKLDTAAFTKKLAEEAAPLLGDYKNLTSTMQGQAISSQTKLEQTLISAQAKESAKWRLDEHAAGVSARGNEIATSILAARNRHELVEEEGHIERAYQFVRDLMVDPKLPDDTRTEVLTSYLSMLAGADVREVPERLRLSGALDGLQPEQLSKLDTAIRESQNRTRARDNLGAYEYGASVESRLEAGSLTDKRELDSYVQFGITQLGKSSTWGTNLYKKFFEQGNEQTFNQDVLAALAARDRTGLTALLPPGTPLSRALDIQSKYLAQQGRPESVRLAATLQSGLGIGELPKSWGRDFMAAVNAVAISNGDADVDEEQVRTLQTVLATINQATLDNPAAAATLLDALPEEGRGIVSFMMAAQDTMSPVDALRLARGRGEAFANLEPRIKQAKSTAVRDAVRARVEKEWGDGEFMSLVSWAAGVAPEVPSEWNNNVLANAVQQEVNRVAADPTVVAMFGDDPASEDKLTQATIKRAYATVQQRTINVGDPARIGGKRATALVLPPRVNIGDAFPGIGQGDKDVLAKHLATSNPFEGPLPEDALVGYRFLGGDLWAVELDSDGKEVNPLDHKRAGQQIRVSKRFVGEVIAKTKAEVDANWGEQQGARIGKPFSVVAGKDGRVLFNTSGENAYGLSPMPTYKWRKELIAAEGLRLEAYTDANGVAVGVGRNVTGKLKPGDRISAEEAQQWFREDTESAIRDAQRLGTGLGVTDDEAILGIAGMIYQHGDAGLKKWDKTLETIADPIKFSYEDFAAEARRSDTWANPKTRQRVERFITRMRGHWE